MGVWSGRVEISKDWAAALYQRSRVVRTASNKKDFVSLVDTSLTTKDDLFVTSHVPTPG